MYLEGMNHPYDNYKIVLWFLNSTCLLIWVIAESWHSNSDIYFYERLAMMASCLKRINCNLNFVRVK